MEVDLQNEVQAGLQYIYATYLFNNANTSH